MLPNREQYHIHTQTHFWLKDFIPSPVYLPCVGKARQVLQLVLIVIHWIWVVSRRIPHSEQEMTMLPEHLFSPLLLDKLTTNDKLHDMYSPITTCFLLCSLDNTVYFTTHVVCYGYGLSQYGSLKRMFVPVTILTIFTIPITTDWHKPKSQYSVNETLPMPWTTGPSLVLRLHGRVFILSGDYDSELICFRGEFSTNRAV